MEGGHNSKELLKDFLQAKSDIAKLELEHNEYK